MNRINDLHVETLSALMDGESDDLELRRFLKQLPADTQQAEVLDTWRRFHLARSALHGEPVRTGSQAAAQRIIAAIEVEPAYTAAGTARVARPGRGQLFARLAVAASVAVAVFLGMQTALSPDSAVAPGMAAGEDTDAAAASSRFEAGTEVAGFDVEAQRRLNEYIQNVSIQYDGAVVPQSSLFEEIPLLRQVNQIQLDPQPVTPIEQQR